MVLESDHNINCGNIALEGRDKRRELFCQEYVVDMNATQAAIRAGYSQKGSKQQGSRLLTYVDVQDRIANLFQERLSEFKLTQEATLQELKYLLFSDIGDLFDENGKMKPPKQLSLKTRRAISYYEETVSVDRDGNPTIKRKVRFWNKDSALDKAMKYHQLYKVDDNLELIKKVADIFKEVIDKIPDENIKKEVVNHFLDSLQNVNNNKHPMIVCPGA